MPDGISILVSNKVLIKSIFTYIIP